MEIDNRNNIKMTRGDTEMILVSCPKSPFMEGDTITFTVRKDVFSPKVIEKRVTEFNWEGKATIYIDPVDTAKLQFGSYLYDIQWTKADGTVKTIIQPAYLSIGIEVSYDE